MDFMANFILILHTKYTLYMFRFILLFAAFISPTSFLFIYIQMIIFMISLAHSWLNKRRYVSWAVNERVTCERRENEITAEEEEHSLF